MSISKTVAFAPLVLAAGRLGAAIKAAMEATGLVEPGKFDRVSVHRKLADGSEEEQPSVPVADIDSICDLSEDGLSISGYAGASGPTWHYLGVHGGKPGRIRTETPTAGVGEQMIETLMATAGLARYVEPPEPDWLTAVRAAASPDDASASDARSILPAGSPSAGSDRRLRAFLSYRFGNPANEAAAGVIQRFLELENVEVLTGRSYEPRPLHEKVADRLAGLDLLVLIVGVDGESAWGRDEISTARALGAAVIPIVTDGAKFDAGLFGDLEYITVVPAHIGDAMLPLLEALTYIRRRIR
jgi:hypothetical protein